MQQHSAAARQQAHPESEVQARKQEITAMQNPECSNEGQCPQQVNSSGGAEWHMRQYI